MATSGTINGAGSVIIDCPGCCTTATCNKCGNATWASPNPCNSPGGAAQYKSTFTGTTLCACESTGVGYSAGVVSGSLNNSYTLSGATSGDTICDWEAPATGILDNSWNNDGCGSSTGATSPQIQLQFYKNVLVGGTILYEAILQVYDSTQTNLLFRGVICQSTPFDCCQSFTFTNGITSCQPLHTDGSGWNLWCDPGFNNSSLVGYGGSAVVVPV